MLQRLLDRRPGKAQEIAAKTIAGQMAELRAELMTAESELLTLRTENDALKARIANRDEDALGQRVRICSIPIDPVKMTSQLRSIDTTLRVEWEHNRLCAYCDHGLVESKVKAVQERMRLQVDLT